VCPGYVRTPLVEKQIADQAKAHNLPEEEVLEKVILQPHAVKELIEPSEVAGVVAFLISPAGKMFTGAPITLDQGLLNDYRAEHPLSRIFPLLYDVLGKAAEDCDSVMAVADEHGQLLWVCGRRDVLRRAEAISFVEGAQWDEEHAGTNAPGTALRLDAPVTIKAAEHFVRPVQRWSCAAAPIHDPVTRRILGVVDVTGGDDIGSPQTIAMIRAAARMAELSMAAKSPEAEATRQLRQPAPTASEKPQ